MTSLDLKDRRILYELDSDSRQSCRQIGTKVGLSAEVVNYRIRRLEKDGIITHYQVIVNLSKLGIIQFRILLSLQHMNSAKLRDIISSLKRREEVKWIVECKGRWDMILALETESIDGVNGLKDEILALLSGHVKEKAISILVSAETHNRDYLIKGMPGLHRSRMIMASEKPVELEELDFDILKQLVQDGRRSVVEIAKRLKTSARIVNYRLRQMRKNKVILGFKIALDYSKLGISFYKTFIQLDCPDSRRIKTLKSYLANNPNVIHSSIVLAGWDMEPEYETYSEQEFDICIRQLKDDFADIIKSIDVITITKEHKFVYF